MDGQTDPKTLVQRLLEYGEYNVLPDSYNLLKEAAQRIQDHEECDVDRRRLVRELDVLINGEAGSAKQASLCDIVGQVRREMSGLAETDMAKQLRNIANDPMWANHVEVSKSLLAAAAHEIDRYYRGMINWKTTAEQKDNSISGYRREAIELKRINDERVLQIKRLETALERAKE